MRSEKSNIMSLTQGKKIFTFTTLTILALYFLFSGLTRAQGFLAPFVTAFILALVVFPISKKMEKKGISRSLASFLSTFLIFLVSIGFMALFSYQIKSFIDDWPEIKETMTPKIEQLQNFVVANTPLSKEDVKIPEGDNIPFIKARKIGEKAVGFFPAIMGLFGTYFLTFIYIFFMLRYRRRFKIFILKFFEKDKKSNVSEVIDKSTEIAPSYLLGKFLLIMGLAIVYSIGLGVSGVNNFILVSAIAALFTLIPYLGNIAGVAMAMAFGYLTSGDTNTLIGIIITFSVAQVLESYVLQPFVIGDKVDLHPFFVIVVVVIGNMVWGIIGMILAIPVMAIFTVLLLNIPVLQPFGFLFSKESIENTE